MYAMALYGFVIGVALPSGFDPAMPLSISHPSDRSSMIVLVESGSGSGPVMGTGKSGTGKETDAGRGVTGKKSPFGSDQPTSGDFSPNPSDAARSQAAPEDKTAGSEQPSGIGEKGSGQTRSSPERSGGPQPSASVSMSKSAGKHGEGKTERAAKDLQSRNPSDR